MGNKFSSWVPRSDVEPNDFSALKDLVLANRNFTPISRLQYGDHGLQRAHEAICSAINSQKHIALYADYDVDGTMSCVSWIWFFKAIGYSNYSFYIPDRFKEGYGLNMKAVEHLVEDRGAGLVITMDTGITANEEAAWCLERGVDFVCTDHHKIQPDKMPNCIILNPKTHPNPDYQDLCGCGITFVLLRQLAQDFQVTTEVWQDILALTGMATICDVVPLNGVNHRLAQHGVLALIQSKRPVLVKLLKAAAAFGNNIDERDVGFRLGPRINAVGRLQHAKLVVNAFVDEDPEPLIAHMGECNEERKLIQARIVREAEAQAGDASDGPVLFLGGDWHEGVVGIAASKIAEKFWRPTFLFSRTATRCKGSARSIPGFDITDAMAASSNLWQKFGGHEAAAGFSFAPEHEEKIRQGLVEHVDKIRQQKPNLWQSSKKYDCKIPNALLRTDLAACLKSLRPFGHRFEEPLFQVEAKVSDIKYYKDKTTGEPKHTAVHIDANSGQKIMFFNEVISGLQAGRTARFLVSASSNVWRGREQLTLMAEDFDA